MKTNKPKQAPKAFDSWLWPDKIIGKRESRMLREEHNNLVDSHAQLLNAAQDFLVMAEKYIDTSATHDGLINCKIRAKLLDFAIRTGKGDSTP